jgi:GTPase SAR1 family protein
LLIAILPAHFPGESGVGKSSILGRFKDESFAEAVPPTEGVNFGMQSVMVDNTKIGLEIVWLRKS